MRHALCVKRLISRRICQLDQKGSKRWLLISNQGGGKAIMFATRGTTTPLGQAIREQRSPALLVLVLFALSSLLILLSGCGTPGTGESAVTAPVAQARTVRQVRVHLAPAPTISTTVRVAQRHLYTFAMSNVGLTQPAV